MAIATYVSPSGETLWKASACVRSTKSLSIRVQKAKFAIRSEWEAKREETRLIRECERAVALRETQGSSWGALVDAWEQYLAKAKSATLAETTRSDYVSAVRKYTSLWWRRPAAGITRADVLEVLNQLKAHSSSISYQNKVKAILNGIFQFGIDHQLIDGIDRSPAYGISLGRDEEKKPEILTCAESRKLLEAARRMNHVWFPIWSVALFTGMRSGELYALRWSDVDFENKVLSVNMSFNPRMKCVKSTKAGYWRHVPICDELRSLLEELKATAGNRPEVLPRLWKWTKGQQARELRAFCEGMGLPSIKFHTLRACFATQLISKGIAPAIVMKVCGWKDLETMQRYIRLAGIEIQGATDVLSLLPAADIATKVVNLFTRESIETRPE